MASYRFFSKIVLLLLLIGLFPVHLTPYIREASAASAKPRLRRGSESWPSRALSSYRPF